MNKEQIENAMANITLKTREVIMDYAINFYHLSIAKILVFLGIDSPEGKELLDCFDETLRAKIYNAAQNYNKKDKEVISEIEHILSVNNITFNPDYLVIKKNLPFIDNEQAKNLITNFKKETPIFNNKLNYCIFSFEDIGNLGDNEIQVLLNELEPKTIALALKGINPKLQEKIFINLTKRNESMVKEDMEFYDSVSQKNIEDEQIKILQKLYKLEEEGKIHLKSFNFTETIDKKKD